MFPRPAARISRLIELARIAVAVIAYFVAVAPARVGGEVVLLKNGELLYGHVERHSSHLVLQFDPNVKDQSGTGQISIDQLDVALIARTVDDLVARLHESCLSPKPPGPAGITHQIQLAEWCLQHKLLDQCERMLETMEPPLNDTARDVAARLDSARAAASRPALPQPPRPTPGIDSIEASDLVHAELLAEFCAFVQPLLVNNCIRCHAPGHGSCFTLKRKHRGQAADRRLTRANLLTVIGAVERGVLLEACLTMHDSDRVDHAVRGPNVRTAVLSSPPSERWRNGQLERLTIWVDKLSSYRRNVPGQMAAIPEGTPKRDPFDPGRFNEQR